MANSYFLFASICFAHFSICFTFFRSCTLLREHGKASRLTFAYSEIAGMNDHICDHTDAERGFVTTTTEIELDLALRRGYQVTHLYT